MSLIKCYECEKEISDLASDCPSCGAPRHIIISIKKGDVEAVKKYLNAGGHINAKYDDGTPLNTAAFTGNEEIVELLISKGADVNGKNKIGATPLIAAIHAKQIDIVKLLVSKNADVNHELILINEGVLFNAFCTYGATPLGIALYAFNNDKIKAEQISNFLIENGADINWQEDEDGPSYLHTAGFSGNHDVAQFLIDKGIDVNIYSRGEATALDWAQLDDEEDSPEKKHDKSIVSDLLKEHGGKTAEELKAEEK